MKLKHKAYLAKLKQQSFSQQTKNHQNLAPTRSPLLEQPNLSSFTKHSSQLTNDYIISSNRKEATTAQTYRNSARRQSNYLHLNEHSEGKEQLAWIANLSSEISGRRTTLKSEQSLRSNRNRDINGSWESQIYEKSYSPSELDYLKIIREKEQTIKELREILQQMDKNSATNNPVDQQKWKQAQKSIKEYQKQIKVLQIENQCLINVIQNKMPHSLSNKECILQREVMQLRETLKLKEEEVEQTRHCLQSASEQLQNLEMSNRQLTQHIHQLQLQCQKLVKMMKEKVDTQKDKNELGHLQMKKGEKLSLSLIKQQYNQNLTLMKCNFKAQVQNLSQNYQKQLQIVNQKVHSLLKKVQILEQKKQNIAKRIGQRGTNHESNKQINLEIQFLLQKFQRAEKDLEKQKSMNQKLNSQLQMAQQTLRSFQIRSFQVSQILENSEKLTKEKEAQKSKEASKQLVIQITHLKQENADLKGEKAQLQIKLAEIEQKRQTQYKNFETKLQTVIRCYENQLKDRKIQIEQKIKQLQQNYLSQLEAQNVTIEQIQKKNAQLSSWRQYQSQQYRKFAQLCEEEIKSKNQHIQKLQKQLQILELKVNERREQSQVKKNQTDLSLIQELSQLKTDFLRLTEQITEQKQLIAHYQTLQIELEFKIQQNHRCLKETESLRQQIAKHQQERNILSQKLASLQKAIAFQEQLERQRKIIYEQLFVDKNKLQKQAIFSQKMKLGNKQLQSKNEHLKQILQLIQKLMATEKQQKSKWWLIERS